MLEVSQIFLFSKVDKITHFHPEVYILSYIKPNLQFNTDCDRKIHHIRYTNIKVLKTENQEQTKENIEVMDQ